MVFHIIIGIDFKIVLITSQLIIPSYWQFYDISIVAYDIKILFHDFINYNDLTVKSHVHTVFIYDISIDCYLTMAVSWHHNDIHGFTISSWLHNVWSMISQLHIHGSILVYDIKIVFIISDFIITSILCFMTSQLILPSKCWFMT